MKTILLITDQELGEFGSFIGDFDSDSIDEAREHAAIYMNGMKEAGHREQDIFFLTFTDKNINDIKREMPHVFYREEEL